MEIEYIRPRRGRGGASLSKTRSLLSRAGLDWDENAEVTVNIIDAHPAAGGSEVCATGSRHKNVIKCVAASPEHEGEGLIATVVTELVKDAHANGFSHIFIFTKPQNAGIFGSLGFYPVAAAPSAALLENRRDGIAGYAAGLPRPEEGVQGVTGAIVANCNPFTNGHRWLVETASKECGFVYLFILSEDASDFPAQARLDLARESVADLNNVAVCPTGDYLISYATFPDYFIKDKAMAKVVNYELDLTIFAERFAKPLGITRRYVGSEPSCAVTAGYNRKMLEVLPGLGVEVRELPRVLHGGRAVSASAVRALLREGRLAEVKELIPLCVYEYLEKTVGHAL